MTRRKKAGALILADGLFAALTVSAAEYFQLKKELAFSLDIPSDPLSSMLMDFSEEEVSVTEHGVTVRAEQAICDRRATCICPLIHPKQSASSRAEFALRSGIFFCSWKGMKVPWV